jgi:putative ABC transport system permease protein
MVRLFYIAPLRLRSLFRRKQADEELDEELRFHLERAIEQKMSRGLTFGEARHDALLALQGLQQRKEECREARGVSPIENLMRDIIYATRVLRKSPIFTLTAILSLTLGIGATTAIFQLLDTLRMQALPVRNPRQLVEVSFENPQFRDGVFEGPYAEMTAPLYTQIRDRAQGLTGIFAWGTAGFAAGAGESFQPINGLFVSGNLFQVLGVQPYRGRLFMPGDDRRGCAATSVVLSHAFWMRQFGGRDSAVGSTVVVNNQPQVVIGVTPPEFFGMAIGERFDVASPMCTNGLDQRDAWWLKVMGRLRPGWTREQATAQLETISPAVMQETQLTGYDPEVVRKYLKLKLKVVPASTGSSALRDTYQDPLWLLLAVSAIVLAIACANLANLLLARAGTREREIAVRLALGASRGRVIRQLLTESLLLAGCGALLGSLLASVLSHLLITSLNTQTNEVFLDIRLDWHVLAFTAATAGLTCVLFGLAPALRATRTASGTALKATARGNTAGRERFGLRRILVTSQVALSLMLVVGALLFIRSLNNLMTMNTGFRQDGVLVVFTNFSSLKLPAAERPIFRSELLQQIRSVPGVEAAAGTTNVPLGGASWTLGVNSGTHEPAKSSSKFTWISDGYFRTMGIPMLLGRDFGASDTSSSRKVAVVNEKFLSAFMPGVKPLGHTFRTVAEPGYPATEYEIIGAVRNTKYDSLRHDEPPIAYIPDLQHPAPGSWESYLIHTRAEPTTLIPAVRRALTRTNPQVSSVFYDLRRQIRDSLLRERLIAQLTGFFGVVALLLAAVGLYGVLSYLTVRRAKEIGIRMALGSTRSRVVRMIAGEAVMLVSIGLAIGIVLSLAAGRLAASMLYGLRPEDPFTLAAGVVVMAAIAGIASGLPALRAARVDPMSALREE